MRALVKCLLFAVCWIGAFAYAERATENVRHFRFAVIQQPGSDGALKDALAGAGGKNVSFLVINGIKSAAEPCTDDLYRRRHSFLNESALPLFVSPVGSDWIGCKSDEGKTNEVERLQRLRELFFEGDSSLGTKKIKLVRQSMTAKFRDFPENVYWQQRKILFATIHLPAENNHYLAAAGRNSEFEDRLIANRHWLERVFNLARLHKMRGIVLFVDGNPMATSVQAKSAKRDGFLETRKQIALLSSRFPGKVLLVHGNAVRSVSQIVWNGNLGTVSAGQDRVLIDANPSTAQVFTLVRDRNGSKAGR